MKFNNTHMSDVINPFVLNQKFDVFVKTQEKSIMSTEQLLSGDRIIDKPELGNIKLSFLVDRANKVNIYMTTDVRKIYLKLSAISNYILRYIEGNLQYNQDIVYINTRKFMEEAEIKSRTTFYKGIEELCKYGFITHYHKQNKYWINPFRFFNGDRMKKYNNNLNNLSD